MDLKGEAGGQCNGIEVGVKKKMRWTRRERVTPP
jgi:hypothetical protein